MKTPHRRLWARDLRPKEGLFRRIFYHRQEQSSRLNQNPKRGFIHIELRFPDQDVIEDLTRLMTDYFQTRGVWVSVRETPFGKCDHGMSYQDFPNGDVAVYHDGIHVGAIVPYGEIGFAYQSNEGDWGEHHWTVDEVKRELEGY